MSITIRRATRGDEPALLELNSFVQTMHADHVSSLFKKPDPNEFLAWFKSVLEQENVQVWLAEEEGKGVGYVSIALQERAESPFCHKRRYFEIDAIAVRAGKQRTGVGRQLIEHVLKVAIADGVPEVELSCWAFNQGAQEAFRRLGFSPRWTRFWRSVR
jgi:GNAT superfamily N-acetyltransferase